MSKEGFNQSRGAKRCIDFFHLQTRQTLLILKVTYISNTAAKLKFGASISDKHWLTFSRTLNFPGKKYIKKHSIAYFNKRGLFIV